MLIPKLHLERFKMLYKRNFNEELTDDEAQRQGLAVMRLVAIRQLENTQKEDK